MTPTTRYRRIVLFFASVVFRLIGWEWVLPRLGCRALVERTRSGRLHRIAASFRALAIEMGGVLIKVGQFLSSRVDVLPEEITSELAGLQDEVPPEPFAIVRDVMKRELGDHLFRKLATIDERPRPTALRTRAASIRGTLRQALRVTARSAWSSRCSVRTSRC
jgi:predicted unusual protein kinase regulating ubiquinone biosynthesis (AarF/ABC1/UbiB family)